MTFGAFAVNMRRVSYIFTPKFRAKQPDVAPKKKPLNYRLFIGTVDAA
jgi:hypothetical protein